METIANDSSLCGCSPDLIKIQQSLKVVHGSAHVYLGVIDQGPDYT